jgi:hypothetical protein
MPIGDRNRPDPELLRYHNRLFNNLENEYIGKTIRQRRFD